MKGSYWRIINHSELNFWQTLRWISHQKQTWIFFNFRKWSRFKIQKSFSWQVGIVAMQCKVLQSIAMYCNVLQIVEEQCIAMYCIVTMQCKILQSIVRNVLQNIAKYCKYCKVLQRISTYCKVFQRIAKYFNLLQRIAMNCIVARYCRRATLERITADHFQRTLAGQSWEMSTFYKVEKRVFVHYPLFTHSNTCLSELSNVNTANLSNEILPKEKQINFDTILVPEQIYKMVFLENKTFFQIRLVLI